LIPCFIENPLLSGFSIFPKAFSRFEIAELSYIMPT